MNTTTLYRPVGLTEFALILESVKKGFPHRLDWQPIFYPVLNQQYAEQIAREWNTKDAFSGYCGIVTSFELHTEYLTRYEVQNVGAEIHNELWIPAADLEDFNSHFLSGIHFVSAFFGEEFKSPSEELDIELRRFY